MARRSCISKFLRNSYQAYGITLINNIHKMLARTDDVTLVATKTTEKYTL